jgi:iron complex transport system substrate-binding protein
METNTITGAIVEAAYGMHEELGPGLFESVYEVVLSDLLIAKGLAVQRQVPVPIRFAGKIYDEGFRADLIVEERVIVEVKSVDRLAPVHKKQLLTYLKLSGLLVGLLINFGGELLKGNIERLSLPGAPVLPEKSP